MKKLLIGCIALLAVGTANAKSDIDEILMREKIIDSNYKYINLPLAEAEFKRQFDKYKAAKISLDRDVKANFVEFTPYSFVANYQYLKELNNTELSILREITKTPDFIHQSCQNAYFEDKYLSANNVNVVYNYFDINNKPLFSLKLNNQTCS